MRQKYNSEGVGKGRRRGKSQSKKQEQKREKIRREKSRKASTEAGENNVEAKNGQPEIDPEMTMRKGKEGIEKEGKEGRVERVAEL